MSSPSLSDSPSTFKVDCNVAGAFLEKLRIAWAESEISAKFFRIFLLLSSFFYQHGNLLNQRAAQVGFYIIQGQRKNKMEDKIPLQTLRGFMV